MLPTKWRLPHFTIAVVRLPIASEFSVGFNDRGVYLTDAAWAIGRVVFSLLKLRNGIMP